MATKEEIQLIIDPKTGDAVKELKKVNSELDDMDKAGKKAGSTMSGPFKAALAAGTVALAAAGVALKKSVDAASDLEEATNKFNVVFKDNLGQAEEWASELQKSYAMSRRESVQFLSSVQDLLVPLGMNSKKAGEMSSSIVKLAADLASFNNLKTADVMRDLQAALTGESEPMKKYGVIVNETAIKHELLNNATLKGLSATDSAAKAQAAYAIMLKQTTAAQGDMINTANSYANLSKKFGANMEDTSAAIGKELLPSLSNALQYLNHGGWENNALFRGLTGIAKATAWVIDGIVDMSETMDINKSKSEQFAAEDEIAWRKAALSKMSEFEKQSEAGRKLAADIAKYEVEQQKAMADTAEAIAFKNRNIKTSLMLYTEISSKMAALANTSLLESSKKEVEVNKEKAKAYQDYLNKKRKANEDYLTFIGDNLGMEIVKEQEKYALLLQEASLHHLNKEVIYEQHQLNLAAIMERFETEERNKQLEKFNSAIGQAQQMTGQLQGIFTQYYKNKGISLENDYKKEKEKILATVTDKDAQTAALEDLDKKYDKKRASLQYEQAKLDKKIQLVGAIMNTATAVTRALTAGPIAGPILAGIIGTLGGIQIGLIASQPIPKAEKGGIISGSASGTQLIAGEKGKSEAIIPLEDPRARDMLGGMGGTTININIGTLLADDSAPRKLATMIDTELTKLRQDGSSTFANVIERR